MYHLSYTLTLQDEGEKSVQLDFVPFPKKGYAVWGFVKTKQSIKFIMCFNRMDTSSYFKGFLCLFNDRNLRKIRNSTEYHVLIYPVWSKDIFRCVD